MQNNFNLNLENLSHSLMLISQDEKALDEFSLMLAKKLLCQNKTGCGSCIACKKVEHKNHADVLCFPKEKDVLSVEEILEVIESVFVLPFEADKKIYVLNNFSSASGLVQNKLLKTLEEPPKNVFFVLNVSNETKILPTIKSRCQKIYLPKFDNAKILESLKNFEISEIQKQNIVGFCDGMKSKAQSFAENLDFENTLNLTFDVWKNLRRSPQVLEYASKFYTASINDKKKKQLFEDFLFLYSIILRDVVYTKLGKLNLVKNKSHQTEFNNIANDFSLKALYEIEKFCVEVNERLARNCNQNIVVDNFLLKILEERAKWL